MDGLLVFAAVFISFTSVVAIGLLFQITEMENKLEMWRAIAHNTARNMEHKVSVLVYELDKANNKKYRDTKTGRYLPRAEYYKKLIDMDV